MVETGRFQRFAGQQAKVKQRASYSVCVLENKVGNQLRKVCQCQTLSSNICTRGIIARMCTPRGSEGGTEYGREGWSRVRQKGLGTWETKKLEEEESKVKPSLFENHGSLKRNQVKARLMYHNQEKGEVFVMIVSIFQTMMR